MRHLDDLLESTVERAAERLDVLIELDGLGSTLGDALRSEFKLLVDLLVGAGSTEAVEAELLVGVLLPAEGGHDLDGHGWDAVGNAGELVVLCLGVEDLHTWHGDDTGLDALVGEGLDGVEAYGDLGTSGNEGDLGGLVLEGDVTTLDTVLESGILELGKVLAGQGENGWGLCGGHGHVVGGRGLVAISWAPDHHVGQGTEVGKGLDRLVGWSVLTKTNGVVGGDIDDALVREGGKTDGTGGVRDEVQESATSWDDGAVGGHTVHHTGHGVLTHTVAHVMTRPVTKTSAWGLEVDGLLPASVVGASQVSRA